MGSLKKTPLNYRKEDKMLLKIVVPIKVLIGVEDWCDAQNQQIKSSGFSPHLYFKLFLGPRRPLRLPLVPVVPSSATKIPDSKLILFLIQTLSSRNLSHSTQNTEQDHLADLSSPIWSCL